MTRVVVVGADAAGMSAAHQALRAAAEVGRELEVVVLDKGQHTSYSACGLPYWMAGDVDSGADLVARTAEQHRAAGIDLRLGVEVVGADLPARTLTTAAGETVSYDELVVATGAPAVLPDWAHDPEGNPWAGIGVVKTIDDGQMWRDRFEEAAPGDRVVVVGAGYVGIEVVEAALRRGLAVTVLTRGRGLSLIEEELSVRVVEAMRAAGADVALGAEVTGVEVEDGRVVGVCWGDTTCPAEHVVVAVGVRPATEFLAGSGLEMADNGALRPDGRGRVADHVWAAGDCCEVRRRIDDAWVFRPLGTHANKHGRALGDNLGRGGDGLEFPGVLDTSITRFVAGGQHVEIARTGLGLAEASEFGFDAVALVTEGSTASGYMPEAEPIMIWVAACRSTRRLLGVQIVGGQGAGKRIDTAAAVLWAGGSIDDLAWMDLSYAPPFATAWEILQIAARRVAERL
jgi:NADPH-dependent 2,4-dienoyl-CoA reductase/sulfur reductase-like enzyme